MQKTTIIIDDQKEQAEGLSKGLKKALPQFNFESYSDEQEILEAIEIRFYSLAIVDIRMDKFKYNGIDLVNKIFTINPFAKVIIVSAFKDEYAEDLKKILLSGKVVDILDKKTMVKWVAELAPIIFNYYNELDNDPSEINSALLQFYADAKNDTNTYTKGERFEHFVSLLFQSFGFKYISKRFIDKSLNEVDLIIRNEINDNFISKFGKYILIECKNKPNSKVSKNDFILFKSKIDNSNGLAELGIIATTGFLTKNTYYEAIRDSKSSTKIIFLSNPEFEKLINASDKLSEFKRIMDTQVKDN